MGDEILDSRVENEALRVNSVKLMKNGWVNVGTE